MSLVLLDTNVLVYAYDTSDPKRQGIALGVVRYLGKRQQGCLSVQSLSEFASVALRKFNLSPSEVMAQVEAWQAVFSVFELTPAIVLEAARGVRDHRLAFYDAQIWASARLHQVPFVWSEDFQDGLVLDGVRCLNPFAADFELEDI
ncbi:MAG: PIN domain-containing protein [Anaerolineales bacterium]|nr:PIN domain-containing protein [Anaerolineales bacterium]